MRYLNFLSGFLSLGQQMRGSEIRTVRRPTGSIVREWTTIDAYRRVGGP